MGSNLSSKIILPILLTVQFLIYMDRGIIPGSLEELNSFISLSLQTSHPDVYLGLLQSSFVIGLSISCPIIAHYSHTFSPYRLISFGVAIWMIGALIAGLSYHMGVYSVLLIGRILSGVGEAALISLVPPLIMKKAEGPAIGLWMGTFCAIIPVGTAAGYCYASLFAGATGNWGTAFILEAIIGAPFVLIFLGISTFSSSPITSPDISISTTASSVVSDTEADVSTPKNSSMIDIGNHNEASISISNSNTDHRGITSSSSSLMNRSSSPMESKPHAGLLNDEDSAQTHFPSSSDRNSELYETSMKTPRLWAKSQACLLPTQYEHEIQNDSTRLNGRLTAISPVGRYVSFARSSGCLSIYSDDDSTNDNCVMGPSKRASLHQGHIHTSDNDDSHHLSFWNDLKAVLGFPTFVWLAVGYSSYSASVMAFSTFGSAFLMDLGFLSSETLASVSMGATVALSGVVGGIAGGFLASMASRKTQNRLLLLFETESESETISENQICDDWPEIVDVQNALPHDALSTLHPMINNHNIDLSNIEMKSKVSDLNRFIELSDILIILIPVLIFSIVILCLASFVQSLFSFLIVISIGLSCLFSTQAGLNIATMLSVPESQRTCSIAMITLLLHLTGDVPSPIIVGLIKDLLAPNCTTGDPPLLGFNLPLFITPYSNSTLIHPITSFHQLITTDTTLLPYSHFTTSTMNSSSYQNLFPADQATSGSSFTPSAACRDESFGIRATIFLTTLWLGWMVIGTFKSKESATLSAELLRSSTSNFINSTRR